MQCGNAYVPTSKPPHRSSFLRIRAASLPGNFSEHLRKKRRITFPVPRGLTPGHPSKPISLTQIKAR